MLFIISMMSDPQKPDLSTVSSPRRRTLSPKTFDHETVIGRTPTTVVHKVVVGDANDPIAVKQPATHGTLSRDIFDSFRHEGKRWSQLTDHPHIVGVVDWGESPLPWLHHDVDVPWVAMEYMDGGDLNEYVGNISVEATYWVAEQLADAVWYAHHDGGGLIHHDLKPENILFRKTPGEQWDVPKIADWELAQTILNHSDSVGVTTPQYIAPEQAHNESTDQLTDQFQLGIVLYELFTGAHPFIDDPESTLEAAVVSGILQNEPAPPSELRSILSPNLDDILLRMLAKNSSDRYEAMLQVRNDLGRIQRESNPSTDQNKNQTESNVKQSNIEIEDQGPESADTTCLEASDQESKSENSISISNGTVVSVSGCGGSALIRTELANDGTFYLSNIEQDIKFGQDVLLCYEVDEPGTGDIIEVQPVKDDERFLKIDNSHTFEKGIVVDVTDSGRASIKTGIANDGVFHLSDIESDLQSGETVVLRYEGANPTASDVTEIIPITEFDV
jgi:serine/threonine protein kinase